MRERRKTRTNRADDEPVIQLSRGQMVLAVCGLLIGALVFYLLGVVTSRIEDTISANEARNASGAVRTAPDAPGTPPSTPRTKPGQPSQPEGAQTSPRTNLMPSGDASVPSTAAPRGTRPELPNNSDAPPLNRVPAPSGDSPDAGKTRTTITQVKTETLSESGEGKPTTGPKPVELPPEPAKEKPAESTGPNPKDEPEPAGSPAPQKEEVAEKKPDANQESGEKVPDNTGEKKNIAIEKIEVPPETAAPAAAANAVKGPFYSIQLIAFSTSNRAKAEAYAKDVRENAGLDVELEESSDGKYIRVYMGRYADKASAMKACEELKKQQRFKDAYVPQKTREAGN